MKIICFGICATSETPVPCSLSLSPWAPWVQDDNIIEFISTFIILEILCYLWSTRIAIFRNTVNNLAFVVTKNICDCRCDRERWALALYALPKTKNWTASDVKLEWNSREAEMKETIPINEGHLWGPIPYWCNDASEDAHQNNAKHAPNCTERPNGRKDKTKT